MTNFGLFWVAVLVSTLAGAWFVFDMRRRAAHKQTVDICKFRLADDRIIMRITTDDGRHHDFSWYPNQVYAASTQMGLVYMSWVREQRGDSAEVVS